ncbi:MAG: sulfatase-like hydrolase/transferase [Clostridia bacterium]|nr:sulfatase-like hydrolase/transferase [Clostridia bacterium]
MDKETENKQTDIKKTAKIGKVLSEIVPFIPAAVLLSMLVYALIKGWYFGQEEEDIWMSVRFAGMILMAGFAVIAALLRKSLFSKISGWVLFALTSPAVFLLIESYDHNVFTGIIASTGASGPVMKTNILIMNVLIYLCVLVCVTLASSHTVAGIMTVSFVAGVFGFCNLLSMQFRSAPIYPWDVFSLGTAVSVLDNYTVTMTGGIYFIIYCFVFIFSVAPLLNCRVKLKKWWINLIAAAVAVAGTLVFFAYLRSDSAKTKYGYYTILFSEVYLYRHNGVALTLTWSSKFLSVEKPANYSKKEISELYSEYEDSGPAGDPDGVVKPNIIVIMNEALSDPLSLGLDFSVNEDYLPFIHVMGSMENAKTGYVYVSVKGGNTPNSEYEFLTGMTCAFLPAGSIPYQQYVSDAAPTLVSQLESLGYVSMAMHPYYPTGWQRNKVYPLFDFDEIFFISDMRHRQRIRGYVSDRAMFDELIDKLNGNDTGKPLFYFGVTMQNHSSYTQEYDGLRQITVDGVSSVALEQYLTLMKRSDEAFEYLIHYIENNVTEPTVVLMFGDHQPLDSVYAPIYRLNGRYADLTSTDPNVQQTRYSTPYVLWANYDVDFSSIPDDLSLNYLAGALVGSLGLEMTPFQNWQLTVRERFPILNAGGFFDTETGSFYDISALETMTDPAAEKIRQYNRVEYNYIFEKKHRTTEFFVTAGEK